MELREVQGCNTEGWGAHWDFPPPPPPPQLEHNPSHSRTCNPEATPHTAAVIARSRVNKSALHLRTTTILYVKKIPLPFPEKILYTLKCIRTFKVHIYMYVRITSLHTWSIPRSWGQELC